MAPWHAALVLWPRAVSCRHFRRGRPGGKECLKNAFGLSSGVLWAGWHRCGRPLHEFPADLCTSCRFAAAVVHGAQDTRPERHAQEQPTRDASQLRLFTCLAIDHSTRAIPELQCCEARRPVCCVSMVGTAAVAVGTVVCAACSMQLVTLLAERDLVAHCQRGVSIMAKRVQERPCTMCQGSGRVPCSKCNGLGAVHAT